MSPDKKPQEQNTTSIFGKPLTLTQSSVTKEEHQPQNSASSEALFALPKEFNMPSSRPIFEESKSTMAYEKNDPPVLGKFGPLPQPVNGASINNAASKTVNSFHGVAPFRFDCIKASSLSQTPTTQVNSKKEIKQSEIVSQGV